MSDQSISEDDTSSSLKEQLQAAKDSIEFIKSEHAYLLKGLHEEIEKLHHTCRDLQFRCEAEGCIVPNNEFFKCSPRELESKVDQLMKENAELKRRLSESHQAIDILDQKEKLALWQHHQELEQRDSIISRLEKELEAKCSAISQITNSSRSRKKGNFWRRFSFSATNSSPHPSTSVPRTNDHHLLCREDLPSEMQGSLPSYESQYQSCSSYSSLSDKSVSDDEGFGQTTKKKGLKLPPIAGPQLVRQQLRIHSNTSLAIDQVPDTAVKRLSKA